MGVSNLKPTEIEAPSPIDEFWGVTSGYTKRFHKGAFINPDRVKEMADIVVSSTARLNAALDLMGAPLIYGDVKIMVGHAASDLMSDEYQAAMVIRLYNQGKFNKTPLGHKIVIGLQDGIIDVMRDNKYAVTPNARASMIARQLGALNAFADLQRKRYPETFFPIVDVKSDSHSPRVASFMMPIEIPIHDMVAPLISALSKALYEDDADMELATEAAAGQMIGGCELDYDDKRSKQTRRLNFGPTR